MSIINLPQQTGCQVQIEFGNKKQMERFVKWFNKIGFRLFLSSTENRRTNDATVTSMCTDEKMDWGHYYELE